MGVAPATIRSVMATHGTATLSVGEAISGAFELRRTSTCQLRRILLDTPPHKGMAMSIRRALLHAALFIGCAVALPAVAVDGLITRPSPHSVDATIEKFEAAAKKRGFVVFARLDHAAAAES